VRQVPTQHISLPICCEGTCLTDIGKRNRAAGGSKGCRTNVGTQTAGEGRTGRRWESIAARALVSRVARCQCGTRSGCLVPRRRCARRFFPSRTWVSPIQGRAGADRRSLIAAARASTRRGGAPWNDVGAATAAAEADADVVDASSTGFAPRWRDACGQKCGRRWQSRKKTGAVVRRFPCSIAEAEPPTAPDNLDHTLRNGMMLLSVPLKTAST
jgi:hypothetical protein